MYPPDDGLGDFLRIMVQQRHQADTGQDDERPLGGFEQCNTLEPQWRSGVSHGGIDEICEAAIVLSSGRRR